jgi:hypothetical protein
MTEEEMEFMEKLTCLRIAWASIDRVGMTWHLRSGGRRQGLWTTCRVWDLEKKQWQGPGGRAELDMSPELTRLNELTSSIPDFGNCIHVGRNAPFYV